LEAELLVVKVPKEFKVFKVHKARKAIQDLPEHKAPLGLPAFKDL
jgi:hypothetical protein